MELKDNLSLGYHELSSPNYGYYIDKIPLNVREELDKQINPLIQNFNVGIKNNEKLAGEIEHEYLFSPTPVLSSYIQTSVTEFEKLSLYSNNLFKGVFDFPLELEFRDMWVNFQQKYEYNPLHNHSGVYSFVIWHTIPYLFEDEYKYSSKPLKYTVNHGQFAFCFPNGNTQITYLPLNIDKRYENYIAIFPSTLVHTVYPFYSSDEYRITVSGNIRGII